MPILDQVISSCTSCELCSKRAAEMFCAQPSLAKLAQSGAEYALIYDRYTKSNDTSEIAQFWEQSPALLDTMRSCSMCNYCTSACPQGLKCSEVMVKWRCLLSRTGYSNTEAAKSVMVDEEWHIFSVYRAVFGIDYADLPILDEKQSNPHSKGQVVDTIFFPGCTLVSYAEELVSQACASIAQIYPHYALELNCCGSPLNSAGVAKRAAKWRQALVDKWTNLGIKQVIFVCAGCQEELGELLNEHAIETASLPQVLLDSKSAPTKKTQLAQKEPRQVALFDSCHDREGKHSIPLQELLESMAVQTVQLKHSGKDTLCCGAGGTVATYKPELCQKRLRKLQKEVVETGQNEVIVSCPTCAYTFAYDQLFSSSNPSGEAPQSINCQHYLELVYASNINWKSIFANLENMWTGEYADWVQQQLT